MTNYVLGFAFNEYYKQLLLIEKEKPDWQKGLYNGIGGKIRDGEPEVLAMIREFREEAGLFTLLHDWRCFCKLNGSDCQMFCFVSGININQAKSMEKEQIRIFDLNELPENKINNLSWLIPMALASSPVKAVINEL